MFKKYLSLLFLFVIIVLVSACGLIEPNEHTVTIDNQRNETVFVTFIEDAVPIGYLNVAANSIGKKKIEGDSRYTILISSSAGTWSTSNQNSDIKIIVPTSGKPYEK